MRLINSIGTYREHGKQNGDESSHDHTVDGIPKSDEYSWMCTKK